jgi:stage V sporulation protein SpoVS
MSDETTYAALADFLIPAFGKMPKFSDVCSYADVQRSLDFRVDLKEGFARGLATDLANGAEAHLEMLNKGDGEAFTAITTVAIATYYMNPAVRDLIGYPGQENVSYDSKETQVYLTDGSLGRVIARGRKYRPTPGL